MKMDNLFDCKILLVDDEPALCKMLKEILQKEGFQKIVTAADCKQARELFQRQKPDGVILDVSLPDGDGFALMSEFRSISAVPVLFLSARDEDENRLLRLGLGADDYITKPFNNVILMARIRTALRKGHISKIKSSNINEFFRLGNLHIDYDKRIVTVDKKEIHLTPIEYRIIVLLSLNAGTVLTHEFLCRELWGPYVDKSKALRVNVANLRRKIEKDTADPQYILTEMGVGYRMLEEEVT